MAASGRASDAALATAARRDMPMPMPSSLRASPEETRRAAAIILYSMVSDGEAFCSGFDRRLSVGRAVVHSRVLQPWHGFFRGAHEFTLTLFEV